MFCKKCGKELPDEAKFCPFCGYHIENNEQSVSFEEIKPIEAEKTFSLNENSDLKNINIILLAASIVIAVLSLVFNSVVVCIIMLSFAVVLTCLSLLCYIKKRSKYDILSFAFNVTFVLYNAGMLVYLSILK